MMLIVAFFQLAVGLCGTLLGFFNKGTVELGYSSLEALLFSMSLAEGALDDAFTLFIGLLYDALCFFFQRPVGVAVFRP